MEKKGGHLQASERLHKHWILDTVLLYFQDLKIEGMYFCPLSHQPGVFCYGSLSKVTSGRIRTHRDEVTVWSFLFIYWIPRQLICFHHPPKVTPLCRCLCHYWIRGLRIVYIFQSITFLLWHSNSFIFGQQSEEGMDSIVCEAESWNTMAQFLSCLVGCSHCLLNDYIFHSLNMSSWRHVLFTSSQPILA